MKSERKEEKNLMAATWTKAAKVRRAFKAGRQRQTDFVLDAERAVLECRLLSINIRHALLKAEIFTSAEDLRIGLAMMTPKDAPVSTVHLIRLPLGMSELPKMFDTAAAFETKAGAVPLGIVVRLKDREAGNAASVWVQMWLTGSRAAKAAKEAMRVFAASDGEDVSATFE